MGECQQSGKYCHATAHDAWDALRGLSRRQRQNKQGHVYRCRFCRKWHITRMSRREGERVEWRYRRAKV